VKHVYVQEARRPQRCRAGLAFPLHAGPSSLPRGSHTASPDRPSRRNRERARRVGTNERPCRR